MLKPRDLERELEALRRMPCNKSCPNCDAVAQFGFKDVNVKHATFLCHDCKSAHQAFSHRVKSLGMSTFTEAEVDALTAGGNARAAVTWLGRLTREQVNSMAPARTAKPTDWHLWIKRIYEDKEFLRPSAGGAVAATPPPLPPRKPLPPTPASAPSVGRPTAAAPAAPAAPAAAPARVAAPLVELGLFAESRSAAPAEDLDWGDFVAAPSAAAAPLTSLDGGFGARAVPASSSPLSFLTQAASPTAPKLLDLDALYNALPPAATGRPAMPHPFSPVAMQSSAAQPLTFPTLL